MDGTPSNSFIRKCIALFDKAYLDQPEIIIETGTYYGAGALEFSQYFKYVHTIELSEKWYRYSYEYLKPCGNVFCHLGNSVHLLPEIINHYDDVPVAFYLDAHYSGSGTATGPSEVPVLEEIAALINRKQKDLVIIDDLRLFGTKGVCGHTGNEFYPPMEYDWRDITLSSIVTAFGGAKTIYQETFDDKLVIIRNLSPGEKKLLE